MPGGSPDAGVSALLELSPGAAPGSWGAAVLPHLCVGSGARTFLFGGIALAACIEVMERTSGAPATYASGQFLGAARAGDELRFSASGEGGSLHQCFFEASRGGQALVRGIGGCGRRDDAGVYQGTAEPALPAPADCEERSVARQLSSNLQDLFEFRLATGALPDRAGWSAPGGQALACWVRSRNGAPLDRRLLAVIADCAALAVPGALGRPSSGSSLDNAIRFAASPEGEWALAATRVDSVRDGLVHTRTRLFSEQGALLAVASQTMVLRLWE